MSPFPSVNGMVNTSGSVPPARAAVNVGAVQLYSSGSTVIQGYFAWNSPICSYSASTASWVTPGRRAPTTIVTGSCSAAWLGASVAAVLGAAVRVPRWRRGWRLPWCRHRRPTTMAMTAKAAMIDAGRRVLDRIAAPL